MIVVDASVLVEVFLRTPAGDSLEPRLRAEAPFLNSPHVVDLEVAHALRRLTGRREVAAASCAEAIAEFLKFPLIRWPHVTLLPRIWELRDNVTAYDAAYVALAETLDAPLLTRDRRLAASAGHRARIEVL